MSTTSPLASVDWPVVAAAIATFITTIYLSLKGWQKGKLKVESGQSSITSIVGASLIENETIRQFTEQMRLNNICLQTVAEELRRTTASITRQTDLDLMQSRKPDYHDERDNRG